KLGKCSSKYYGAVYKTLPVFPDKERGLRIAKAADEVQVCMNTKNIFFDGRNDQRVILSMKTPLIIIACLWTAASACSGMKGASTSQESRTASSGKRELRADIVNPADVSMGTVKFSSGSDGHGGDGVTVEADIRGLVPAGTFHGIHIHANNNRANGDGCI